MLAGLEKVKDTEHSEHTAIRPAVPSPRPPSATLQLGNQSVLKISVPQQRPILVLQNPRFKFFGFETYKKSEKRYQEKTLLCRSL